MSTRHCPNKVTYRTITNKFNTSKTFLKQVVKNTCLSRGSIPFFYNYHCLFIFTEALKYPHICMSLVFEADEAKNKCFRKHELMDIFYH